MKPATLEFIAIAAGMLATSYFACYAREANSRNASGRTAA